VNALEDSAHEVAAAGARLERCPHARVDAVDVDPRWRADLDALEGHVRVEITDYLERPPPERPHDLAVTNPPFDGGAEVEHLAKMLDESVRIAALLPARSLHGRKRYERIWRRFDASNPARDWW